MIDFEEKIGLLIFAFILAIIFGWAPWLAYIIISSVFSFPDLEWAQATFFTWVGFTLYFWIKS